MLLELKMTSDIPIYQQIYEQIVIGIAKGQLQMGEPLPTVRQLAEDIGINVMTVSKAYNLLKNDGYIETDRRLGSRVVDKVISRPNFQEIYQKELELLLATGVVNGLTKEQFTAMTQKIIADFKEQGADN
ncbi:GntR family transcriptional regulator [Vagococcus elongatus]|uniref:GntR family transcriptional regulator n=1 Tax=Vagococcus elongatus TaxID=180344 RepID=A0A430B208_9ENTE|nr:GntR family transcriptional regulator [Vagococcus elongatus]RSU14364.1 GntR family transcriptional regulator [Vagococcus elongatus]